MPTKEALQALKTFRESRPPNSSLKIATVIEKKTFYNPPERYYLPNVRLQLHCDRDGGVRYFDRSAGEITLHETWAYRFVSYSCRDCGQFVKTYALLIKRDSEDSLGVEIMKLGEFLPFAAPISKRVQKLLMPDDLELYRKGTRAEAQGLGIGAATYFRRIVDSQWKLLVTEIRDAAAKLGEKDLSVFDKALQEIQFSAAVDMLKDRIPQKLPILDGENPLTLLSRPLSVGLHDLTDTECLQQAADIRTVLTALLENIADVLKEQNDLKEAANRLKQVKSN